MLTFAQNYKSGALSLLEVPRPLCKPGGVLVRTQYSLISAGTEMMKIKEAKMSLVGMARARPDQVKKVMQSVQQQGLSSTYSKAINQLDSYTPLGYSICGEVVEVGAGVSDIAVGDRIAGAGNKYALHAEYNWVPRNLVVPVPDGVESAAAAYTTVGSIAMQGFRQSEAVLGESAVVIGLGLVGQLLVQILVAAGVRVVGIDPADERCQVAVSAGAAAAGGVSEGEIDRLKTAVGGISSGHGADHVFLTAGGSTNQPVEIAPELARDRARVTDIGKCSLDLPWNSWYEKELDLRFSRSYGPGRYDPSYEEDGKDYPIGYVRWTEGRNMECFVDLLQSKSINMDVLTADVVPFSKAIDTYEQMNNGELRGIGYLFEYGGDASSVNRLVAAATEGESTANKPVGKKKVALTAAGIGLVGAGNYASSMLIPHLAARTDVKLVEVATATALSAANAQKKFGFERISTDFHGLLADPGIQAVVIATRHGAHASMVCDALRADKTVFVEKPLAIDEAGMDRVRQTIAETGNDRLVVGFNRRFAPLFTDLRDAWGKHDGPMQVRFDVNAGRLASDSWYSERGEHGSRLVGEGCHFIDTCSWWIGSDPIDVHATATSDDADDAVLTLRYPDGSVATIAYMTNGHPRFPKERFQVFGGGRTALLENYRSTELWAKGRRKKNRSRSLDKGQRTEMNQFVDSVLGRSAMPIALDSILATTATTFAAERSLASRLVEPVQLSDITTSDNSTSNG